MRQSAKQNVNVWLPNNRRGLRRKNRKAKHARVAKLLTDIIKQKAAKAVC
jgi:hypothetical protein